MKVDRKHLSPIPDGFRELPSKVFCGGLSYCQNESNNYAVLATEKILENCEDVFFTPHKKIGQHIFGSITVLRNNGSRLDLVNELVRNGVVVQNVDAVIPNGIEQLLVNKMRYEKMNQLCVANLSSCVSTKIAIVQHNFDDEENPAQDWSESNQMMNVQFEMEIHDSFQNVIRTLDEHKMSIPKRNLSYEERLSIHLSRALLCSTPTELYPPKHQLPPMFKRFFQILKEREIGSSEKKENETSTKPLLFIPSGHEDHLGEFLKYNAH